MRLAYNVFIILDRCLRGENLKIGAGEGFRTPSSDTAAAVRRVRKISQPWTTSRLRPTGWWIPGTHVCVREIKMDLHSCVGSDVHSMCGRARRVRVLLSPSHFTFRLHPTVWWETWESSMRAR